MPVVDVAVAFLINDHQSIVDLLLFAIYDAAAAVALVLASMLLVDTHLENHVPNQSTYIQKKMQSTFNNSNQTYESS